MLVWPQFKFQFKSIWIFGFKSKSLRKIHYINPQLWPIYSFQPNRSTPIFPCFHPASSQLAFGPSPLSPATAHLGIVFLFGTNRDVAPQLAAALCVADHRPPAPR
jgi:hypothetical protein